MSEPGALRSLWFKWKSLRLPWRKKWLCGHDLTGTTYWEFRPTLSTSHITPTSNNTYQFPSQSTRPRRIAQPPRTLHASDLQLPPAWIQWLRHTRQVAPTLAEQVQEIARLQVLERLRARESAEKAARISGKPAVERLLGNDAETAQVIEEDGAKGPAKNENAAPAKSKEDPWARSRDVPGAEWQPEAWSPGRAQKRAG